jgi:D-ribose pyranase
MRKAGVIHPDLIDLCARAGHGDRIVLADAGLRIPAGARRVDVGVTCGVPTMAQVLSALSADLVIESTEVAVEFQEWAPETFEQVVDVLGHTPDVSRSHADLMTDLLATAYAYVKTGECTAYSSVVLTCGVSYLDEAIAQYTEIHGVPPQL